MWGKINMDKLELIIKKIEDNIDSGDFEWKKIYSYV
mgnify:CR=1 FL=1